MRDDDEGCLSCRDRAVGSDCLSIVKAERLRRGGRVARIPDAAFKCRTIPVRDGNHLKSCGKSGRGSDGEQGRRGGKGDCHGERLLIGRANVDDAYIIALQCKLCQHWFMSKKATY